MSKWPGCPVVACANDLCAERCQAMIDLVNRLHLIRNHLRTGAVGQREVWEEWLAEAIDELDQLTGSKAALQTEIKRLRAIMDGTERRESEYLALVEKHATDAENLRKQIGSAEQMVYDSGFKLGEAHKLLHERNDEIARLRGNNTKLETENERLKAERHTTKRMLKDILDRHGYSGWDAART